MNNHKWEFPSNNDGAIAGHNDASLRTFRSNEEISLAIRESIQNSLDAQYDVQQPVRVEISIPSIPFKDFPDNKNFKNILNKCLTSKYAKGNISVQNFYRSALELIQGEHNYCDFLRISDFNTTGLKPELFEEVFIKGSGITIKQDEGSAGAHGIGKNSIFNLSKFRTAFYSSIDLENHRSFIGKSILMSHEREDGDTSQGVGYFSSQPGNRPINQRVEELKFLDKRNNPGLDIFISAFKKDNDIKDTIIVAVIENFYPAIHNNNLVVNVLGQEIDKHILPSLIDKFSDKKYEKFYLKGPRNSFPVQHSYQTLTASKENSEETLVENYLSIYEDNDVLIKTLKNNGKDRIHYFRLSGMIVKNNTIRSSLNLTTIVEIKGKKLNNFLKKLENVSHDDWQVNQIDLEDEKEEARKILPIIQEGIKENINQFINQNITDQIDMSGAAKYLRDDLDEMNNSINPTDKDIKDDDLEKTITEQHKNFEVKKTNKKIAKKNQGENIKKYQPDDEGPEEEFIPKNDNGSRKINKKLKDSEEGEIEKKEFQNYALNKIRLIDNQGDGHYAFVISSNENINCYFSINAVSEDGNQNILEINECLSGRESFEINDKKTIVGPIEMKSNQEMIIHVSLKDQERMALQLNPFIYKNE